MEHTVHCSDIGFSVSNLGFSLLHETIKLFTRCRAFLQDFQLRTIEDLNLACSPIDSTPESTNYTRTILNAYVTGNNHVSV